MGENAILMGYIGEEEFAAPTLNTVTLARGEAAPLFERVLKNIHIMLANGIVHADLSAYNILYWEGEITFIDFPQIISPLNHPQPYPIFARDIRRICEYFAGQGLPVDPAALASELWQAHGYGLEEGQEGEEGEEE
jgi:RIO kinase 1